MDNHGLTQVGENLTKARRFSRTLVADLAERLGVSRVMVHRYETGEAVGSQVFIAYSDLTGISSAALLDSSHPVWRPINEILTTRDLSEIDLTQAEVEALGLIAQSGSYQFSQGHYIRALGAGYVELHRNRYGQERVRLTDKGRAVIKDLEANRG